jgi:CheY-like chemotaxis protein
MLTKETAKILIVEDEAIIAMEIENQMQGLGYPCTLFHSRPKEYPALVGRIGRCGSLPIIKHFD